MIRLIGYFFGIGTVMFLVVAAGVAWYIGDVSKTCRITKSSTAMSLL
jgi:hypothetical protein